MSTGSQAASVRILVLLDMLNFRGGCFVCGTLALLAEYTETNDESTKRCFH